MVGATLENRLKALEEEVADLKAQVQELGKSNGSWVQRLSGSMKDIPAPVFDKFRQYCAEIRQADRPPDEET